MSVRRLLADCVVLSLQDASLFYPCCKNCFSRMDLEKQDTTRWKCFKCGSSCQREQIDYRYRLSLRVARDCRIFGVTVFGSCLNPFFGIHASGLRRLMEDLEGPAKAATGSTLLVKAVEDCFIGRHFIFGIKVADTESWPLPNTPTQKSSSKDLAQFTTSQMILPKGAGLEGCSVVSYYQILLQKAAEHVPGSPDSGEIQPPQTPLLRTLHHSPECSLYNTTPSFPDLLSQPLQRSQDCTLSPTPPWRQSLGLVTSSAEQEEDCSGMVKYDRNREKEDLKIQHSAQKGSPAKEQQGLSFLLSLENSCYNIPSLSQSLTVERAARCSLSAHQLCRKFDPTLHSQSETFCTRQLNRSSTSSSLIWEDLPFSESLGELLCEKDFDQDIKTNSYLYAKNLKETTKDNLKISPSDQSFRSPVCHSVTQMKEIPLRKLLDLTNRTKDPAESINSSQSCACSDESHKEDEKTVCSIFEDSVQEQLDVYNCSEDLFSGSPMIDMDLHTDNNRMSNGALLPSSKNIQVVDRQDLNGTLPVNKVKGNSLITKDVQSPKTDQMDAADMNTFIPSSQSTPIIKPAISSRRAPTIDEYISQPSEQDSCGLYGNLPESISEKSSEIRMSLSQLNSVRVNHRGKMLKSTRCRNISRRIFRTPDNQKHRQRQLTMHKGAQHMEPKPKAHQECDASFCDVTESENNYIVDSPTSAAKSLQRVRHRGRRQTDNSVCNSGRTQGPKEVNCGQIKYQTVVSQMSDCEATGCDKVIAVDNRISDGYNCNLQDDSEVCDWSRDLFSESEVFSHLSSCNT